MSPGPCSRPVARQADRKRSAERDLRIHEQRRPVRSPIAKDKNATLNTASETQERTFLSPERIKARDLELRGLRSRRLPSAPRCGRRSRRMQNRQYGPGEVSHRSGSGVAPSCSGVARRGSGCCSRRRVRASSASLSGPADAAAYAWDGAANGIVSRNRCAAAGSAGKASAWRPRSRARAEGGGGQGGGARRRWIASRNVSTSSVQRTGRQPGRRLRGCPRSGSCPVHQRRQRRARVAVRRRPGNGQGSSLGEPATSSTSTRSRSSGRSRSNSSSSSSSGRNQNQTAKPQQPQPSRQRRAARRPAPRSARSAGRLLAYRRRRPARRSGRNADDDSTPTTDA